MLLNVISRLLHKLAFILPGGYSLRPSFHRLRGCKLGNRVWISQLVYIDELHPEAVTIGDNSTIGFRTSIFTHFYWGGRRKNGYGEVFIGKDVFIGPHCLILPNVRIGDGAVIKGGTVVSKNVPPYTLYGAPPAIPLGRVTVPLTPEYSYEEFIQGLRPIRRSMHKND
jgi:acetyltransferase-like isoleucine patch superfamily enzyme